MMRPTAKDNARAFMRMQGFTPNRSTLIQQKRQVVDDLERARTRQDLAEVERLQAELNDYNSQIHTEEGS